MTTEFASASFAKRDSARDRNYWAAQDLSAPQIHYPTGMYDSYVAHQSERARDDRKFQQYAVQSARKSRTFFYNGLDGDGFDSVINPVIMEPPVQFTLNLKLKHEVEQRKAK